MASLKFDAVGEKVFETGVEQCALYVMKQGTVTPGESLYEEGVAWNGITSIEENPEGGEETVLWADNIEYASLRSKEKYKATINAYTYPTAWEECDGSKAIIPGVVAGQQSRRKFGIVFKSLIGDDVNGQDAGYKLHIIYNASASVSSKNHQTINDSPEAEEFSWEISAQSVNVIESGIKPLSTITIDSRNFQTTEAKAKLTALENMLFGTDGSGSTEGSDPELPDPDTVFSTLKGTTANKVNFQKVNEHKAA